MLPVVSCDYLAFCKAEDADLYLDETQATRIITKYTKQTEEEATLAHEKSSKTLGRACKPTNAKHGLERYPGPNPFVARLRSRYSQTRTISFARRLTKRSGHDVSQFPEL
jgi:hypothetical protein